MSERLRRSRRVFAVQSQLDRLVQWSLIDLQSRAVVLGDQQRGLVRFMSEDSLALLWQFGFDGVGEEFLAVGASPGWRPCEEVEDGLPDGRHARLWRRSPDSFFSVPLL